MTWTRIVQKLRKLPELADVNSDQQDKGLQSLVVFDRSTASRLGEMASASWLERSVGTHD